jgi:hypothetical protein
MSANHSGLEGRPEATGWAERSQPQKAKQQIPSTQHQHQGNPQLQGFSMFSLEYGAQRRTKRQTPSSKEAPNLKLQTKVRAMWWPSRTAR